jgi:hypothetical protein
MGLKERGAITGIGETAYSRNSGKSVVALQMEASLAAIADAGRAPTDIDGIIAYAPSGVVAEDFVTNFGIPTSGSRRPPPWAVPARSPPGNAPPGSSLPRSSAWDSATPRCR